jgi:hypothetical protein
VALGKPELCAASFCPVFLARTSCGRRDVALGKT